MIKKKKEYHISCSLLFIRKDLYGTKEKPEEKSEFLFPTIESLTDEYLNHIKKNSILLDVILVSLI